MFTVGKIISCWIVHGHVWLPAGIVIYSDIHIPKAVTLWLFSIAIENGSFIDVFPIKTSIDTGLSVAMLNNQMVSQMTQKWLRVVRHASMEPSSPFQIQHYWSLWQLSSDLHVVLLLFQTWPLFLSWKNGLTWGESGPVIWIYPLSHDLKLLKV